MCRAATVFARHLLTKEFKSGSFHANVFNHTNSLTILSCKPDGFMEAVFIPQIPHLNVKNTVSGGVIATLADFLTTLSVEVATSKDLQEGSG